VQSPSSESIDRSEVSFDPEDHRPTMDYRDSSLELTAMPRRPLDSELQGEGLLARKPWLIAVFAFIAVLVAGLLLIFWVRPEAQMGASFEASLPEAPTGELSGSGKAMIKFVAPAGTWIVHDGNSFQPNKAYPVFPGSFTLMYRCPKKGTGQGSIVNASVNIDRPHSEPQAIPLNCR
jgi:hypothetical protein